MAKPVFVLVPSGTQTPKCYDPLLAALATSGYSGTAVSLPSVDAHPPVYDFTEDVEAIREATSKFVEQGKDVVVLHSYGGLPGSEALKVLGKTERTKKGLEGGVLRIVYIMGMFGFEGVSPAGERGDTSRMMPYQKIDLAVSIL